MASGQSWNDSYSERGIIGIPTLLAGVGIGIGIYSTFQHEAVQYNIIYNSDMSAPFCCYTNQDL